VSAYCLIVSGFVATNVCRFAFERIRRSNSSQTTKLITKANSFFGKQKERLAVKPGI
jgi:hypothetical protein